MALALSRGALRSSCVPDGHTRKSGAILPKRTARCETHQTMERASAARAFDRVTIMLTSVRRKVRETPISWLRRQVGIVYIPPTLPHQGARSSRHPLRHLNLTQRPIVRKGIDDTRTLDFSSGCPSMSSILNTAAWAIGDEI